MFHYRIRYRDVESDDFYGRMTYSDYKTFDKALEFIKQLKIDEIEHGTNIFGGIERFIPVEMSKLSEEETIMMDDLTKEFNEYNQHMQRKQEINDQYCSFTELREAQSLLKAAKILSVSKEEINELEKQLSVLVRKQRLMLSEINQHNKWIKAHGYPHELKDGIF